MNWISVKDRLPPLSFDGYTSKPILVCYSVRFGTRYNVTTDHYDFDDQRFGEDNVTHWMPLPEEPEYI